MAGEPPHPTAHKAIQRYLHWLEADLTRNLTAFNQGHKLSQCLSIMASVSRGFERTSRAISGVHERTSSQMLPTGGSKLESLSIIIVKELTV